MAHFRAALDKQGQVTPRPERNGVLTMEAVMGVVEREVVSPVLQTEGGLAMRRS